MKYKRLEIKAKALLDQADAHRALSASIDVQVHLKLDASFGSPLPL